MFRNPRKTVLYYAGLCAIFAAAVIALSSCEQDPTILTEYEGVNLIANKGFDSPDWVPDQGSTYMLFEEATGFDPPADAAGAAVYRLEIKNLVTDGEFEENIVGGASADAWTATGAPGAAAEVAQIPDFEGNCLSFAVTQPTDTVEFDLTTISDYREYSGYIIRFGLKVYDEKQYWFYFPSYDSVTFQENLRTITIEDLSRRYEFPDDFALTTSGYTSTPGPDTFYMTQQVQSGYIDNFRVIRSDIPLRLRITLPWADAERPENLPLVSGWYKFSVYVKSDPAAAGTPNSFASGDVTIGVENSTAVFPEIDSSVSLSDWTQVSTVLFVQINTPANTAEHVLELSVSPTDLKYANSRDSGSLLITAPSLELHVSDPTT